MYHQWFHTKEYGDKEKALIEAIKALGSDMNPYGEQANYDEKMLKLKVSFMEYQLFCENGHKEEMEIYEEIKKSHFKKEWNLPKRKESHFLKPQENDREI